MTILGLFAFLMAFRLLAKNFASPKTADCTFTRAFCSFFLIAMPSCLWKPVLGPWSLGREEEILLLGWIVHVDSLASKYTQQYRGLPRQAFLL